MLQEDLNALPTAVKQLAEQNQQIMHDRDLQVTLINRMRQVSEEVTENRNLLNQLVDHLTAIQHDFQQSSLQIQRLEKDAHLEQLVLWML